MILLSLSKTTKLTAIIINNMMAIMPSAPQSSVKRAEATVKATIPIGWAIRGKANGNTAILVGSATYWFSWSLPLDRTIFRAKTKRIAPPAMVKAPVEKWNISNKYLPAKIKNKPTIPATITAFVAILRLTHPIELQSFCPFGPAAVWGVRSMIELFRPDFERYIEETNPQEKAPELPVRPIYRPDVGDVAPAVRA